MSTEIARIETAGADLMTTARACQIVDFPSYQKGAGLLALIKHYRRQVAEVMDPILKAAHAAHKTATAQKQSLEAPAIEAERIVKERMEQWDRIERERRRLEAERQAAAAREEAQVAACVAAEARGDEAALSAIATAPEEVIVFTPPPDPGPKAPGVSYRIVWTAEVLDFLSLVQAAGRGQVPLTVLQPDMAVLHQMARALKETLQLPGVRAVAHRDVAVRL